MNEILLASTPSSLIYLSSFQNKLVVKKKITGISSLASIQSEAAAHSILSSHPHVVDFIRLGLPLDFISIDPHGVLTLEYCPSNLLDFLNSRLKDRLDERQVIDISRQIASGLAHIHSFKLWHRDIKIENIHSHLYY